MDILMDSREILIHYDITYNRPYMFPLGLPDLLYGDLITAQAALLI